MSTNSGIMSRNNCSKVIGIQFSILSPDEIRKGSVAKITSREMYSNNKPVFNGLFDPRMGVLEQGAICPTDGLDYMQTPGYFGHIEMARPIYYIQYLSTILKIVRCVCFKCSKLLISKEKYKQALNMDAEERWKYVFALASKKKRCGEDTEDGCGCLQPKKFRKEDLATLFAEWSSGSEDTPDIIIKVTPEMVLKIFKRISDEDVHFMGFSPIWSRPEWMICQVMAVPPPAVRPSVKHDAQQRSEDDITHIMVNIIKTNKILQEKMLNNAPEKVIDDWTTVLQYYGGSMINNKIPGSAPVAQRTGRPLKSIIDRLNGKGGRMRGNLMAKRVDFSARSVITADSSISIRELGIPMKIAKNITKPVVVNKVNKAFLKKLILNGPDVHPGAKILEKKNGESITLRYVDRTSIVLEDGDIVHRHMMNGDAILFNRQPTLHRMSMMCHIARIMKQGDTFRMNVADTKPYNADFDGDEMNLHMPQDPESESELLNLAAVPYQIISPSNNAPIIGIYQDSMVGSFQFTRKDINFTPREAMNLLMMFPRVNEHKLLGHGDVISSFNILSQILPPFSLKTKNKLYDNESDDPKNTNNIIEIKNGEYVRGHIDKGVLGAGGLIHRCCNDFGNMSAANFIDDLQNIVTEYMKSSAFSVGISDLIMTKSTDEAIVKIVIEKKNDVKQLIDQIQIGVFENNSGKTNEQEFETQVDNILKKATAETGKMCLKNLQKDNRFVTMVQSGSKGSDLNITFMAACLGQQQVDGKRIPYGFEHRTLPHYTKYDDSAAARGFVSSSYINGLSPQELFFHAMGGRVGLIDTAVKTSTTGYIQRRLIKGLEDLMVDYTMTVRTSKNKIVQFTYGDDNIDTIKVENQELKLVEMSVQDIYAHFNIPEENASAKALNAMFLKNVLSRFKQQLAEMKSKCKFYTDFMIKSRNEIVKNVFSNKDDKIVRVPVAFAHMVNNIIGQQNINANSLVDITPLEAFDMIETSYAQLEKLHYAPPTQLFKTLYYYHLSPKELLFVKRFNKTALTTLLEMITLNYKRAIVAPGEMVGMIAAQSIGEPTTQMSQRRNECIKVIKQDKQFKNAKIISTTIGKFCDDLIAKLPQYTFNTGHANSVETLLDTLEHDYFIVGVDGQEKTHWNKISHVSRHPANGQMMKVTTKSGRVVETTTSHSHLVRKDQTVVPIVGADMKEGMRIPVAKHIDNTFIQSIATIDGNEYELDYLFGWFVGAYLAEGHLNKKSGTQDVSGGINITNISPYFIENTKKFALRFAKECRLNTRPGEYGPGTTTSFSCKPLADFLWSTCDNGSFAKHLPDFAFTAPNEFKAGLIQSHFDGDGNFQCDEKHHQIRSCSRSKQMTKDISLLLNYFDIFGSIKENFTRGAMIYNLAISAKYATSYQAQIGSLVHADNLQELVNYNNRENAHDLSDEIDKIPGLGEVIAKCGKVLALPGQSRNYGRWAKKESIGRRTLEKYIEVFESHPNAASISSELRILNQAASSGVIWDEIVHIEIYTPDQDEFVYDFTVPANQTFMTDYGVIVHNTLNTFHFAGVASKSNVTRGVPRIEEILSLSSEPKNPLLTVYLKHEDETDKEKAQSIMYMLEHTKLKEVVQAVEVCFDPDDLETLIEDDRTTMEQYKLVEDILNDCAGNSGEDTEKSKWVIRMTMDPEVMLEKNITMDDINFTLSNSFGNEITCVYSDYNADKLIFRIRLTNVLDNIKNKQRKIKINPLDQSDQIYLLKNFQDQMLNNVVLRGIKGINKVILRKIKDNVIETAGSFKKQEIWVLDCIGTNMLDVLALDYVDGTRTCSNHIIEIYETLGIEAARQSIYNELSEVLDFDGAYINYHHLCLLCDRMTYTNKLISIFRHGINNDNIGPIAKASFEETPEMFLKAARHAELDIMRGISANVMCGQEGFYGTSAFQVVLDIEKMKQLQAANVTLVNQEDELSTLFSDIDLAAQDSCSHAALTITNNVVNIKPSDLGEDNDYNPGF